jgi:hypothetical protein
MTKGAKQLRWVQSNQCGWWLRSSDKKCPQCGCKRAWARLAAQKANKGISCSPHATQPAPSSSLSAYKRRAYQRKISEAKATLATLAEDPENDEMRAALNRRIEQHKSSIIKFKLIDLEVESCRDAHGNQQAIVDEPLKDMDLLKQFILTHSQCQVDVALDRFEQRQILRRKHFISDRQQAFIELELAGLLKEAPSTQQYGGGRSRANTYMKRARAELDEASELELKRLGVSTQFVQRQW